MLCYRHTGFIFPNLNSNINITSPWVIYCSLSQFLDCLPTTFFSIPSFSVSLLSSIVISHFLLLDCLFDTPLPMRFPSCFPFFYSFPISISISPGGGGGGGAIQIFSSRLWFHDALDGIIFVFLFFHDDLPSILSLPFSHRHCLTSLYRGARECPKSFCSYHHFRSFCSPFATPRSIFSRFSRIRFHQFSQNP